MFITNEDLADRLADSLGLVSRTDLEGRWTRIVSDSRQSAENDILSQLMARGYTVSQIDAWDRGPEFCKDIGLYWCFVRGGAPSNYDHQSVQALDRRLELATVTVVDGEDVTEPAADAGIGFGDMRRDDDIFTRDTRW